jgi:hypothetical protein
MELLIPGLALVALMVYLSTRIKKSAAEAFEPEEIETDEFSIVKSRGFLYPLNSTSGLPFEAYTKDFGEDEAKKIRHARAELTFNQEANLAEVVENAKRSAENVLAEETVKQNDRNVTLLEADELENGVGISVFHKLVENGRGIYDLKISVLEEQKDTYLREIEKMRDSFTVK